jgi:hypothetical protein
MAEHDWTNMDAKHIRGKAQAEAADRESAALATPIAAQPATPIASAPLTDEAIIAIRNATWDGPVQPWGSALRFARGIEAALAAPAQAAAVPEAVARDAATQVPKAWTESHTMKAIRTAAAWGSVKLTSEYGPYSVDRPTFLCDRLVEAIVNARDAQWIAALSQGDVSGEGEGS